VEAGQRFRSILFGDRGEFSEDGAPAQPSCFGDLNLDQVVASITAGREEYELATFFYCPLQEVEAVRCRHLVLRDLEYASVLESVRAATACAWAITRASRT
jgi:DNA mismatch repair protein MutS